MSRTPLHLAVFVSSLVSAYWNGAATYYRGLFRSLAAMGHTVDIYEPDAFDRQAHRDIPDPPWARITVYPPRWDAVCDCLHRAAATADVLVKASGVGVLDAEIEAALPRIGRPGAVSVFWDVDAPATLARIEASSDDPFRACIPHYDLILTYGGGVPVVERYRRHGAKRTVPIYNGLDVTTHFPVPPDPAAAADLLFLGNRLPDREARVERFFLDVARSLPHRRFALGGAGWEDKPAPPNVRKLGHISTRDHNRLNASARFVLNISRQNMAETGFSPATRVFEAAGAGACIITDAWEGIETFFTPGEEILVASDGPDVAALLGCVTAEQAAAIGASARHRALTCHGYDRRAADVDRVLAELCA